MACEIIHNTRWLHATKDTPVAQTGVSLSNLSYEECNLSIADIRLNVSISTIENPVNPSAG